MPRRDSLGWALVVRYELFAREGGTRKSPLTPDCTLAPAEFPDESVTIPPMPYYLDIANWARREVFEFFRDFDKPYFNVCTRLDVTDLLAVLRRKAENSARRIDQRQKVHVSLAYHYFALRAANEVESFRYRLREGRVMVHDVIHGATTVLLPNETFTLAYFDYEANFEKFIAESARAIEELRSGAGAFRPRDDDARIHFTALPWLTFTSFSHARNWRREDSIPKIAFGKFIVENGRTLLPFSVEVHHALVDGLHVGHYVERLEAALSQPELYVHPE